MQQQQRNDLSSNAILAANSKEQERRNPAHSVGMIVSDTVLALIALEKDRAKMGNVWNARKGVRVSSAVYCIRMNRYRVSRAIWSAREHAEERSHAAGRKMRYKERIAMLSKEVDKMTGLPCAGCGAMIYVGEICYSKRGAHGRAKFYDQQCARRYHIDTAD
jgi:hypothetical protein